MYLAAAGVGTIGLVDFDVVESSNLQRQIVHGNSTLGMPKVESAKQRLHDLNPDIQINTYMSALNIDNALELIGAYDIVIDGTDNFTSRYLVNDACAFLKKPLVYGAIYRFDGQISIFNYGDGPCYRCLFPKSPPSELAPNCSAGGVIGVLPGVVGMIQATEAVKLILKIGEPLVGRLMRFDALGMKFSEVRFKRKTSCPTCTPSQTKFAPNLENVTCANVSLAHPSFPAEMYVTPLQLNELILSKTSAEYVLLDVRDTSELEVCQLPDVINIPLSELGNKLNQIDSNKTHYLICYAGIRAEHAAALILDTGMTNVRVLKGGMKRWVRDIEPNMPIY